MATDTRQQVHTKIVELALQLGRDASQLRFDEEIPSTGLLDSAAIIELVVWLEGTWEFSIPQEDLILANFGTIDSISAYLVSAGVVQGN